MKTRMITAFVVAAVLAYGCGGNAGSTKQEEKSGDGTSTDSSTNTNNSSSTNAPTVALPEELTHDGAKALGAPFADAIVYKLTGFPGGDQETTRKIVVEKNDKGEYELKCSWTGTLEAYGEEIYQVTNEGLMETRALGQEVKPAFLYLPAKFEPGKAWASKYSLDNAQDLGSVTITQNSKIGPNEKVTTPLGSYDAAVLIENTTLKGELVTGKTESKTWFASGVGVVKATFSSSGTRIDAQKKKQTYASSFSFEAVRKTGGG